MKLGALAILLFASRAVECWDLIAENSNREIDNESDRISDGTNADRDVFDGIKLKNEASILLSDATENDIPTKRFHQNNGFARRHENKWHLRRGHKLNANEYVRKFTCDRPYSPCNGATKTYRDHQHVGSKIQYHCKRGYSLRGSFWNKCIYVNGTPSWYFPTPTCEREYFLIQLLLFLILQFL